MHYIILLYTVIPFCVLLIQNSRSKKTTTNFTFYLRMCNFAMI